MTFSESLFPNWYQKGNYLKLVFFSSTFFAWKCPAILWAKDFNGNLNTNISESPIQEKKSMETIFGSRKKEDLDACRCKHVSPNLRVQTLPRTNYSHVSKKRCHKFNTHRELASYWHFKSLHSMNHISVLIFLTSSLRSRFRVNLFYFLVNAR